MATDTPMELGTVDIVIDGGNTHYRDDIRRASELRERGIHHVDCGTSGGAWGQARGVILMIGGEQDVVDHLRPLFASIAPGVATAPRTPGRQGRVPRSKASCTAARTAPDIS